MTRNPKAPAPALVLPAKAVGSTAAQTFPTFPGVWYPGVPIALEDLGLTEREASALMEGQDLPLVAVTTPVRAADVPDEPEE